MKYTSKLSLDSAPDFRVDPALLEWLDLYVINLFSVAAETINAGERDDKMLEARGARQILLRLINHYNSTQRE